MTSPVTKAMAKGVQEYVFPIKKKLIEKSIRRQNLEINGLIDFGKGLYHNQHYENHMKKLVQTKDGYRNSKDLDKRKQFATDGIKSWKEYIELRKKDLPDEYQITEKMKGELKQSMDLVKDRHQNTIKPSQVLKWHEEYVKLFKFDIPIDAKNLARLIHPHYAYLSHFPNPLTFDEVINIYENKVVSGYEEYLGQELLASEIAAYTYWTHFDKDHKGYMSIPEFAQFLKIFRISLEPKLSSVKEEFKFAIGLHQGEFDRDIEESKDIVRFDFMRYIFLERNL